MAQRKERVEIGRDPNGKPLYAFASGNTPKQLHANIARLYLENGLLDTTQEAALHTQRPTTPLFKEYARKWYTTFKMGTYKPSTLVSRNSLMQTHIYTAFPKKRLDEIKAADVQALYNTKAQKGAAKTTIQLISIFVKGVFDAAMEDGLITRNPARDRRIRNPSSIVNVREALTQEQTQEIIGALDRLDGTEELYMSLAIYAAMRKGEILGLKWEDIDLRNGYIHVKRNATYPSNTPEVVTPKTAAGVRRIPIVPALAEVLKRNQGIGWLFGNRWDEPIHDEIWRRMWRGITEKIDLHGATSHVFRHTFITLATLQGIPPATVQAIVGHASIQTTLATYTHVQDAHLVKAESQMEEMFTTACEKSTRKERQAT